MTDLPLFPLGTVLFPGCLLPLRVFEQRYLEMAKVCLRDGTVVAALPLNITKRIEVAGALGTSVIEVRPGRARVAADPGPRQYCVKQGWLTQANAVAICAPNHVTLALVGRQGSYDSLNY